MNNLYKALFLAQQQVENAKKNAKNPHYNTKYANLKSVQEAIGTALVDNGILLLKRPLESSANELKISVTLVHIESGENMSWVASMPIEKPTAQGFGIAMTYMRRYVDTMLMDLLAEDEDGEGIGVRAISPAKVIDLKKGVDNPKAP